MTATEWHILHDSIASVYYIVNVFVFSRQPANTWNILSRATNKQMSIFVTLLYTNIYATFFALPLFKDTDFQQELTMRRKTNIYYQTRVSTLFQLLAH